MKPAGVDDVDDDGGQQQQSGCARGPLTSQLPHQLHHRTALVEGLDNHLHSLATALSLHRPLPWVGGSLFYCCWGRLGQTGAHCQHWSSNNLRQSGGGARVGLPDSSMMLHILAPMVFVFLGKAQGVHGEGGKESHLANSAHASVGQGPVWGQASPSPEVKRGGEHDDDARPRLSPRARGSLLRSLSILWSPVSSKHDPNFSFGFVDLGFG